MVDDPSTLTRRTALKWMAGLGTAATAGGAFLASTGAVIASTMNLSGPVSVSTDDGNVTYVRVMLDHELTWDGFDRDVEYLRYIDRVTVRPNSDDVTRTVSDVTSDHLGNWSSEGSGSDGWGGPGEHTTGAGKAGQAFTDIDWNVIGDPNATDPENGGSRSIEEPADLTHLLANDEDGSTKESLVVFEKEVRLLDGNQNELGREAISDDFLVEVTNQEATVDSTASGDASGHGEDEEP